MTMKEMMNRALLKIKEMPNRKKRSQETIPKLQESSDDDDYYYYFKLLFLLKTLNNPPLIKKKIAILIVKSLAKVSKFPWISVNLSVSVLTLLTSSPILYVLLGTKL